MKKETLYAYVRVSTDEQKLKDYSPQRQKDLGKKKADELGMKYEIFEEEGASASQEDFNNRPVFFKLLGLVKDGTAKQIYVFDQSRLSRNDITKAVIVNSFMKSGVQLHTFSKKFDMNKAEDVLTFNILQAIEGYESALRKARFQLGYVSGNKKGRFLKNITPYGYKKLFDEKDKSKNGMLVIDKEEKKVFLDIIDLYLNKNYGTNQIANYLNENNIPTKTSKVLKNGYKLNAGKDNRKNTKYVQKNRWNPGTINSMFKNELITGKRKFKTGKDSFDYVEVEPIIDVETFNKLQEKRSINVITRHKEDKYFYLLKGLLQCGVCGQPMHGRIKPNRGENTYICNSKRDIHTSCGSRGINIDKLNTIVWNSFTTSFTYHKMIFKNMDEHQKNPHNIKNRIKELTVENEKLINERIKNEKRIKDLIKQSSDSRIPKNVYNEMLNEYNDTANKIEKGIASCEANIKMLQSRDQQSKEDESKIITKLRLYNSIQKRMIELFGKKSLDKKSQLEAQKIMNEVIENITIYWDAKKKEHTVEIRFMSLTGKDRIKTLNIKNTDTVKRIELPSLEYSYNLDTGKKEYLVNPKTSSSPLKHKTKSLAVSIWGEYNLSLNIGVNHMGKINNINASALVTK